MSRIRLLWLGIFTLIGFILIGLYYNNRLINDIDLWLIERIQRMESTSITGWMKLFTYMGAGWVVSVISLVLMVVSIVRKRYTEVFIILVALTGSFVLNKLLKLLYERPRPTIHQIITETGDSFPSGHSMNALFFYGVIILLLWKFNFKSITRALLIVCCLFMIFMIGLSRVYLGVHYPTDVLGAYLVSSSWLMIVIFVASMKKSLN